MRGNLHSDAGMSSEECHQAAVDAKTSYMDWQAQLAPREPTLGQMKKKIRDLLWAPVKDVYSDCKREHSQFKSRVVAWLRDKMMEVNEHTVPVADQVDAPPGGAAADVRVFKTYLKCPLRPYYFCLKKVKMEAGHYVGFEKVTWKKSFEAAAAHPPGGFDDFAKLAYNMYIIQKSKHVQRGYRNFPGFLRGGVIRLKKLTVALGLPRDDGKVLLRLSSS